MRAGRSTSRWRSLLDSGDTMVLPRVSPIRTLSVTCAPVENPSGLEVIVGNSTTIRHKKAARTSQARETAHEAGEARAAEAGRWNGRRVRVRAPAAGGAGAVGGFRLSTFDLRRK